MPKSIFSKICFSGIIILIISFVTTGWLMISTLRSYVSKTEEKTALSSAAEIAELVKYRSQQNDDMFNKIIQSYTNKLDACVIICDDKGRILLSEGAVSTDVDEYIPVGYSLNKSQYEAVLNGKTVSENSTFNGYFSKDTAIAAVPLKIDNTIFGGVFVCRALPDTDKLIGNAKKYFIISILALLLFASVIMYFTAKRITLPIKRMKKAAKAFSNGAFDERIAVSGSGEIADLATEFNKMAESLENLENNRRMFVADVSHELRTPMTTISGFVEGMLDGTIPEDMRDKYLKIVLEESKRLTRLVNDLLYAEKHRRKEISLNKESFDINELVRLSLISFESRITDKNIKAEADFLHESETVFADRDSIQRVITNLTDNAVKFCNNGGTLRISTEKVDEKVKVSVFNSGSFIEKEDLNKVFDRFYKSDKSRGVDKTGVGLGLHIVKSIISEHNGEIKVESDENGTLFTFII